MAAVEDNKPLTYESETVLKRIEEFIDMSEINRIPQVRKDVFNTTTFIFDATVALYGIDKCPQCKQVLAKHTGNVYQHFVSSNEFVFLGHHHVHTNIAGITLNNDLHTQVIKRFGAHISDKAYLADDEAESDHFLDWVGPHQFNRNDLKQIANTIQFWNEDWFAPVTTQGITNFPIGTMLATKTIEQYPGGIDAIRKDIASLDVDIDWNGPIKRFHVFAAIQFARAKFIKARLFAAATDYDRVHLWGDTAHESIESHTLRDREDDDCVNANEFVRISRSIEARAVKSTQQLINACVQKDDRNMRRIQELGEMHDFDEAQVQKLKAEATIAHYEGVKATNIFGGDRSDQRVAYIGPPLDLAKVYIKHFDDHSLDKIFGGKPRVVLAEFLVQAINHALDAAVNTNSVAIFFDAVVKETTFEALSKDMTPQDLFFQLSTMLTIQVLHNNNIAISGRSVSSNIRTFANFGEDANWAELFDEQFDEHFDGVDNFKHYCVHEDQDIEHEDQKAFDERIARQEQSDKDFAAALRRHNRQHFDRDNDDDLVQAAIEDQAEEDFLIAQDQALARERNNNNN